MLCIRNALNPAAVSRFSARGLPLAVSMVLELVQNLGDVPHAPKQS